MTQAHQRGMYFEEFEIGLVIQTMGRTITETDIVNFAGLSGDYNQIHIDKEFATSSPLGQRVAHGLLVTSIASGLAVSTGFVEGTTIAFRSIDDWKFSKTVTIGDTIHVSIETIGTKALRRLGGGSVDFKVSVMNQKDDVVMSGIWTMLIMGKPE